VVSLLLLSVSREAAPYIQGLAGSQDRSGVWEKCLAAAENEAMVSLASNPWSGCCTDHTVMMEENLNIRSC
jgi:hypothetical protein